MPPYGHRKKWRPSRPDDYGDGGAFPEISVAQYPLSMGLKGSSSSNALTLQVDGNGQVKYDTLADRGHDAKRVVQGSFRDLVPLRHQAIQGDVSLDRPDNEEVALQRSKTLAALTSIGVKPSNKIGAATGNASRSDPTYVRYTPANQMGSDIGKRDRIIKIVPRQVDPMEPPKFKHKKIPRGPPSPPPPIMHSPPRKLTAADQESFHIPPPISNWKNPKGYTVPLDKRLASDGRGLNDVTINDKFAQFAEALSVADRHAREDVKQRQLMQQKLAEKEKLHKEENLRTLARDARLRNQTLEDDRRSRSRSNSRSPETQDPTKSILDSRARDAEIIREQIRRDRREDNAKKLRQQRMGVERRNKIVET